MENFMRLLKFAVLCFVAMCLVSCSSDSPSANADDILTISVSPATILSQGDTAVVTVRLTTADGQPVFDGTAIDLQANAGSIEGRVTTVDGFAEAVFVSGLEIGEVTITARSGTLGIEEPISATLQVQDRNVPIGSILISSNPSNLTSRGGNLALTAVVLDENGNPLPNKSVVFGTSFGSVVSNGLPRTTDSRGTAQDTLRVGPITSDVSSITVTAQAGSVSQTADIAVSQNEPPVPVILFSPSEPRVGQPVFFDGSLSSDLDSPISSYQWNFGDGNQAEGRLVEHAFENPGTYTVTLIVVDSEQAGAAEQATVTVGENQLPEATFTFSPDQPRVRQTIQFNAAQSNDPDGTIVSYEWNLGNGVTRTGQTINYAYAEAGTYNVTLTVTDNNNGVTVSDPRAVTVEGNRAPTAVITVSNSNPLINEFVSFSGLESTDEDGSIAAYVWDFGDGDTERGGTVSKRYSSVGSFLVTLQVIDGEGGLGFASTTVQVGSGQAPTASFSFSPSSPKVNERVSFNASASSDPDGEIRSFRWDFGDGGTASGKTVAHTYFAAGNYTVILEVIDDKGLSSSSQSTLTVSTGAVPNASLVVRPSAVPPGASSVLLDATGTTDADDPISNLAFNFEGFGPPGVTIGIPDGLSPLREAQLFGVEEGDQLSFTVRVTDMDENRDFAVANVNVSNQPVNQSPIARLTLAPDSLLPPGGQVILNAAETTDGDHDLNQLEFRYEFLRQGDFNILYEPTNEPLQQLEIINAKDGDVLTLFLTVTDPQGAVDTETATLTISRLNTNNQPPRPAFTVSPAIPEAGNGTLVINGSGTSDPDHAFESLSFRYIFQSTGNMVFQPEELTQAVGEVSYTNATAGEIITVFLTVTDPESGSDTLSRTLTVESEPDNSPPVANLVVTPTSLNEPGGTLVLNATGTVDADHEQDQLTFDYEVATTGAGITLSTLGNSAFEQLTVSGAQVGDAVVILLRVTDPLGAQSVVTRTVNILAP
jgi:PKD repeat protein